MKHARLADVCKINPSFDKSINDDAACSFVPMSYVDDKLGKIVEADIRLVKEVKKGYTAFRENDVLFAKITPCMENGKCAIARNLENGIGFGSTEFHVLRAQEKIYPDYVYYFLRQEHIRKQATHWFRGTAGQQRVPTDFLQDLCIPLPPLLEQKRIAAQLAQADRLRQLRRHASQLGESYLQSAFLAMFGDLVSNTHNLSIKPLGSLIEGFEAGVNYLPDPDGGVSSDWRVLKISAVTWGDFDPTESKVIGRNVEFDDNHIVRCGDLLISRANTTELVGAVSMVRQNPPQVLLPDKLWRIKFLENSKVNPEYVLEALRQPSIRKLIGELATGSGGSMKNISMKKAATIPIMVPPLPEQKRFAQIVARYEKLRAQMRESTRQAELLFQGLLWESFGKN